MSRSLRERLATGRALLLDGAVGSELDSRGLPTTLPLWSALGLIEQPGLVEAIHRDYAAAGADIITTNTFRTTGRTLNHAGLDPAGAAALVERAVAVARAAADAGGRDALVAGSIAPLEDCYTPALCPPPEIALREHRELATRLAAAGADFLLVETMPQVGEAAIAARAAHETGLEVAVSWVIDTDGALLGGESLADAVQAVLPFDPVALMVNCASPAAVLRGIEILRTCTDLPVGGYANLGEVQETVGWLVDASFDGDRYAGWGMRWLDAGASLVGGCCGTSPAHIAALRAGIDGRPA